MKRIEAMIFDLKDIFSNKIIRQAGMLFSAEIFATAIGFILSMILSRNMGSVGFGVFSSCMAILNFIAIFFEFGFFASGARLLAVNKDIKKESGLLGALLAILAVVLISYMLTVMGISFFIDSVFNDKMGYIFKTISILSPAFVIPFFMELILKGANRIKYLSSYKLLWKVLYFIAVVFMYIYGLLTPLNVLISFCASSIISFGIYMASMHPDFNSVRKNISVIGKENKTYGIHIYFGRIVDVASYSLDKIMVPYFAGTTEAGFYNLAYAMASPINVFSASLSLSGYRNFSDGKRIPKNIILMNIIWVLIAISISITGGYMIIYLFLGSEYHETISLLLILVPAIAFQGLSQPYNSWLSSNGYGQELKIISFKLALTNIVGNSILIPLAGSYGGAAASLISMAGSFFLYYKSYRGIFNKIDLYDSSSNI